MEEEEKERRKEKERNLLESNEKRDKLVKSEKVRKNAEGAVNLV